ncbi:uncharacterized protein SPPG_07894 [Spizellomyces punctatus DAOM BR117]|uniref:FFD box profile domain-containing protein n=1 Tax=Spizellomyces punctatus (strain DAOM BR117) TaxID=645134 RepID=A0A0L0H737_SPIPD|nr:uncharacterized protein SPPG_07894 [Spizellomyces punctatus DAOM BR117]KNC96681.1 hypothetical protein SPPG_07894 [Spizellomyces punctatus DAOM BR117]|eukprot:XP_016604721.1 hypothetical protein SPPG_07894 [Spizellomyces punctatus DAOM BR117]
MMPYIGSEISLISKSDIRYVGILTEINQQESTVALENVRSFGTEGRKGNPAEELPPSDEIYPFVVFRGSDVKDLHVMNAPAKAPAPSRVPNDPAIVRQHPRSQIPPPSHMPPQPGPPGPGGPPGFSGYGPPAGMVGQTSQPGFPMMPQGMGPYGGPPSVNYPYPHSQQKQEPPQYYWDRRPEQIGAPVFPGAVGGFSAPQQPRGLNALPSNSQQPGSQSEANQDVAGLVPTLDKLDLNESTMSHTAPESKEKKVAQDARPERSTQRDVKATQQSNEEKRGTPSNIHKAPDAAEAPVGAGVVAVAGKNEHDAKQSQQNASGASEGEIRRSQGANGTDVRSEGQRLPGTGAHLLQGGHRRGGGRGNNRRGYPANPRNVRIPVPDSDFDFESANAKFNKTELAQEAATKTGGDASPIEAIPPPEPSVSHAEEEDEEGAGFYQKSSFFDNISCESKDRAEGDGRGNRRARQYEERRLNMETFGQTGVDSGRNYRRGGYGGYRRGGRGRGNYGGYSGNYNGGQRGGYRSNYNRGGYGNREEGHGGHVGNGRVQ